MFESEEVVKLYHQELVPQSFKCSKCGKGKNEVEFYVKPNATRPNRKLWVSKVCKKYWESKK